MPPATGATTGRERHHRRHDRQFAAGARPRIEIADNGARDDHRACRAERLEHAGGDQQTRSTPPARRRDWRRHKWQVRPAAPACGRSDRTPGLHNLPDGEADQIGGNGELNFGGGRVQLPRDVRHRRQIGVHRQRPERLKPAKSAVSAKVPGRNISQYSCVEALPSRCAGGTPVSAGRFSRPDRSDADRCHAHRARPWLF